MRKRRVGSVADTAADLREDALNLLRDALSWDMPEAEWRLADDAVRRMRLAIDGEDAAIFRQAFVDLDDVCPLRGKKAGTEPEVPAPERVRDRINDTITELGR